MITALATLLLASGLADVSDQDITTIVDMATTSHQVAFNRASTQVDAKKYPNPKDRLSAIEAAYVGEILQENVPLLEKVKPEMRGYVNRAMFAAFRVSQGALLACIDDLRVIKFEAPQGYNGCVGYDFEVYRVTFRMAFNMVVENEAELLASKHGK